MGPSPEQKKALQAIEKEIDREIRLRLILGVGITCLVVVLIFVSIVSMRHVQEVNDCVTKMPTQAQCYDIACATALGE